MKFYIYLFIFLLISCGGGSDSDQTSSQGVAIDGYLSNAVVFLDLNENGFLDEDEPSTLTDENGGYSIMASNADLNKFPIVVQAIAGSTIDLDEPDVEISNSYNLSAPPGNTTVSPITTLVHAKMNEGLSLADATDSVAEDLSIDSSLDIMGDYVDAKTLNNNYAEIHNIASALAEVLSEIETLTPEASFSDKLSSLQSKMNSDIKPMLPSIKSAANPSAAKKLAGGGEGWFQWSGDYGNKRYSKLTQINTENVDELELKWKYETGRGGQPMISWYFNPLVIRDKMYIPDPGVFSQDEMGVIAINAKNGSELWKRTVKLSTVKDAQYLTRANRGITYGKNRIYLSTYDARIWSINATTGELDTEFKDNASSPGGYITTADGDAGYYLSQAPIYIPKGLIKGDGPAKNHNVLIIGSSGGEHQVRGHISAFDADNGELLWRFYTVPKPTDYGGDTWPTRKSGIFKDPYTRGGGAVWVTPAFDSKNGLVIFGTGNAAPDFDGTNREGANLFSASIVAVDVATGERVWHFQQVHHDLWDYDQGSAPVIFDMEVNGEKKKVVGAAGKTGWYYLFESKTGKLIHDCPEKSVPTNSLISNSDGLAEKPYPTQPHCVSEAFVPQGGRTVVGANRTVYISPIFTPPGPPTSNTEPTAPLSGVDVPVADVFVEPGALGGSDHMPLSHNPKLGLSFIPVNIGFSNFTSFPETVLHDPANGFGIGGWWTWGPSLEDKLSESSGALVAYDPKQGKVKWTHNVDTFNFSGTCTTAAGLVFMPEVDEKDYDGTIETFFSAFDASTGERLFRWPIPDNIAASSGCISYEISGKQYIAIAVGGSALSDFGVMITNHGDDIYVLGLPD